MIAKSLPFRQVVAGISMLRILQLRYIFYFMLGFAAGRSLLLGLTPFVTPLTAVAAVSSLLSRQQRYFVFAGIFLGTFVRSGYIFSSYFLSGMMAVVTAVFLARQLRKVLPEPYLSLALSAGGADLLSRIWFFLFFQQSYGSQQFYSGLVAVLSEAVLSGLFTVPFVCAMDRDRGYRLRNGVRAGLGLALVLCGLGDIYIGPASIRDVVVRAGLLFAADGWGAGWGAGAGVVLGVLSGDPRLILPRIGLYAGTGFFTGVMKGFGKFGLVLGFALASLFFSAFYATSEEISGHFFSGALAIGIFYLGSRFWSSLLKPEEKEKKGEPLQVDVGISQRAKLSEPVSGDSFGIVRFAPHRVLLMLSDGMGAGITAARESRLVTKMMEKLLSEGISPGIAAEIVNTALFLRGGDESAATIDVAFADLEKGYIDFLKVGAPPSFLKRDGNLEIVRDSCWPAGLLEYLDVNVLRRQILPGDILVMATDGITEADQDGAAPGEWLYNYLQKLSLDDAQVMADLILKGAFKTSCLENRDDMTVLVARFCNESDLE